MEVIYTVLTRNVTPPMRGHMMSFESSQMTTLGYSEELNSRAAETL